MITPGSIRRWIMQDGVNMKAPDDGNWVVAESSLIRRYRMELDETNHKRLMAEAAVDELMARNSALIRRVEEVTQEKIQQQQDFDKKLEEIRAELNETLASREEE
jgi:hypothetical protein